MNSLNLKTPFDSRPSLAAPNLHFAAPVMRIEDHLLSSDVKQYRNLHFATPVMRIEDHLLSSDVNFATPVMRIEDHLLSSDVKQYRNLHFATPVMRIEDHLPSSDVEQINVIETVFESFGRDFLCNDFVNLVGLNDDDEGGDTRVEIRSPRPEFPPPGQLRILLLSNTGASRRRKQKAADGEYCLAACDDGTVKWIHESECVSQNHVWTVRLFERRVDGLLHIKDEIQRPKPNVINNCTINITGGNINVGGTQITGGISQSPGVAC